MSQKKNTIESYFHKINPKVSENNDTYDKKGEKVKTNSNKSIFADKKTYSKKDENKTKTEVNSDFSDDDNIYQDSQLCELLDTSNSESKPIVSTNTNTPYLNKTMFGFTLGQNKKQISTSSKKEYKENVLKNTINTTNSTSKTSNISYENKKNYQDSPHQVSAENEIIGTQLKSSSRHRVLIDTNMFNKRGLIKSYPSTYSPFKAFDYPAVLPYCYREDHIIPYDDGDDVAMTYDDESIRSRGGKNEQCGEGNDGRVRGGKGRDVGNKGSSFTFRRDGDKGLENKMKDLNTTREVTNICKNKEIFESRLKVEDNGFSRDSAGTGSQAVNTNVTLNDADDVEMKYIGGRDVEMKRCTQDIHDADKINNDDKDDKEEVMEYSLGDDDSEFFKDFDDDSIIESVSNDIIVDNTNLNADLYKSKNEKDKKSSENVNNNKFADVKSQNFDTIKPKRASVKTKELITSGIMKLLTAENKSSAMFINTIQSYQTSKMDFKGLEAFLQQLDSRERQDFFDTILPTILYLVLSTHDIITQPIPILLRRTSSMVTMSQLQAACLLANAFMCTYPVRTHPSRLNTINFYGLFSKTKGPREQSQMSKLRCFLCYFKRVGKDTSVYEQRGLISIERKCDVSGWISRDWSNAGQSLSHMEVTRHGCIEEAEGMLQVDFANKHIGGGVLRTGAVQEEIRFCINPEAVISCLISEKMEDNESIILRGCEQFSSYKGYGNTFEFNREFHDHTPRDVWMRMRTDIVAIDAFRFTKPQLQYTEAFILREINKAYCGFSESQFTLPHPSSSHPTSSNLTSSHPTSSQHTSSSSHIHLSTVATGNWGCGAFKGNLQLKAMIQLLAASRAGRRLKYFVFAEKALASELEGVLTHLRRNISTTGQLFNILLNYWPVDVQKPSYDLFTFIKNHS